MGRIVKEGTDGLTGGEVTSLPPHLVGVGECISSQDLDPRDLRGATTRNGRAQFSSNFASGTALDGLKAWTRDNATTFLVLRLGTTFYDASTGSFASIGIGGTSGEIMRAGPLNDLLVIVVDGLAPQKFSGTTLSALGGTPPSEARYVSIHNSKVFMAGDDANAQKITASATNNPEDYTSANDAFTLTTNDGGGDTIQGLASNRKVLVICYRNYTDILIGDNVVNYRVERLIDRGLVSKTGIVSAGEVAFFASDEAVYMVAGTQVSDITTLKFRQTYKDISDKSKITLGVKGDLLLLVDYGADTAYACAYKYGKWNTWSGQPWKVMDTTIDQKFYAGADGGSTSQVFELDSGSLDGAATITAKWRTPNLPFGWSDCPKNLTRLALHAKPGLGTTTVTYYKDGVSTGSTTDLTFSSTGDHAWDAAAGQSKLRARQLGFQFQWKGPGTLYGFWAYAEISADAGTLPPVA